MSDDTVYAILAPQDGESIICAAKRCAAMAAKLPRQQWRCRLLQNRLRIVERELRGMERMERCDRIEQGWLKKENAAIRRSQRNWYRKSDKIAEALQLRPGETLASGAARMRQEMDQLRKQFEPCFDPRSVYGIVTCDIMGATPETMDASFDDLKRRLWALIHEKRGHVTGQRVAALEKQEAAAEARSGSEAR